MTGVIGGHPKGKIEGLGTEPLVEMRDGQRRVVGLVKVRRLRSLRTNSIKGQIFLPTRVEECPAKE